MGTWASIFINTNNLDAVTSKLQQLSNIDTLTKGEFPTADLYNNLLFDDNAKPTYLVLTNTQPEWIMIRHNGFKNLKNWGEELSDYFKTKVIITCAQSNASFYDFSLFDKGEMLREIEYCYSEDYKPINYGKKFDFEDEQPGTKTEYYGEIDYIFDFDNIEEYSKHFGLEVQPDYDNIKEWTILKSSTRQKTVKDFSLKPKPWWKFW